MKLQNIQRHPVQNGGHMPRGRIDEQSDNRDERRQHRQNVPGRVHIYRSWAFVKKYQANSVCAQMGRSQSVVRPGNAAYFNASSHWVAFLLF
jgi:hypothetical protein